MKLILASNGGFLYETKFANVGIPLPDFFLGYITTAGNTKTDKTYIENHKLEMTKLGIKFEEFDLEGKSLDDCKKFLSDKNVIHVEGGDTFFLLKSARECQFKEALEDFFARGGVYIGTSAGAYLAGASIETALWKNSNKNYYGLTDLMALCFVPFMLFAHYADSMHDNIKEKLSKSNYKAKILRDGQAIFCESGVCHFTGKGEEVKF